MFFMRLRSLAFVMLSASLAACLPEQSNTSTAAQPAPVAEQMVALGAALFQDTQLSSNGNQSCASCHDQNFAFSDPDQQFPVSEGSVYGLFGTRNTPSIAYNALTPELKFDANEGLWVGGLFLDGRVSSLEAQAQKPFLNPVEMNNTSAADVVARLRVSPASAGLFMQVFGVDALAPGKEEQAFDNMAKAIAAFERTPAFSPFTSKFDYYLQGKARFSAQETEGMSLFIRADKGNCAACHVMSAVSSQPSLFTDFTYDNIGVPRNPDRKFFAADFVDDALMTTVSDSALRGKFKVASLRNVAKTAPYMHNGIFPSLRQVVEFYNTRDTDPQRWGEAEVPATVNHDELGNLKLSDREIEAIVAFLNTLSDGYQP
jgi:cytochrome c peroxidase